MADLNLLTLHCPVHRELPPKPKCCCGCSVQTGTLIIAICSLLSDIFGIAFIIAIVENGWRGKSRYDAVVVFTVFILLLDIIYSAILFVGGLKVKLSFCKAWILYMYVVLITSVILEILSLLVNPGNIIGQVIAIAKIVYFISVVKEFVADVEAYPSRYNKSDVPLV